MCILNISLACIVFEMPWGDFETVTIRDWGSAYRDSSKMRIPELGNVSVAIYVAVMDDLSLWIFFLGPDDHGRKGI